MKEIFYSDGLLKLKRYDFKIVVLEKGWYHWDETWVDWSGPFTSKEKAKEELKKYGIFLENIQNLHNTQII